jgi:3-oxoacyl-(acyl-carrier-protein) synthase
MKFETNILGGSFITGGGSGVLGDQSIPVLKGNPVIPPPKEVFPLVPARYGRFDGYTKLGCAAIAMALRHAGLDSNSGKTGVVISTCFECMETDRAYFETVKEADGQFSSPNLFSYTLPGIVIGESAILFKLTGPGFTLGESESGRGTAALITAMELLQAGQASMMIAGWLDAPPDGTDMNEYAYGAVFTVLGKVDHTVKNSMPLFLENGHLTIGSGHQIESILDIFSLQVSP